MGKSSRSRPRRRGVQLVSLYKPRTPIRRLESDVCEGGDRTTGGCRWPGGTRHAPGRVGVCGGASIGGTTPRSRCARLCSCAPIHHTPAATCDSRRNRVLRRSLSPDLHVRSVPSTAATAVLLHSVPPRIMRIDGCLLAVHGMNVRQAVASLRLVAVHSGTPAAHTAATGIGPRV
ncbi:hypothetical protein K466DRAFT_104337 [Polyporus arcularius HHB13444]|uniref:Uncharacterized protein n=1 Tax=Polyporus arcularius HHB13444 TaxID=1314778 RepID=A0A5C3PFF9_9APHY|nr:hypothetical protein K466DRAFT_104337 [Polyporus arcularius HHB13444]